VDLLSVNGLGQGRAFRGTAAPPDGLFGIAFGPDGKLLATSDADAPIKLWRFPQ
jgi:WD40 repeat protein